MSSPHPESEFAPETPEVGVSVTLSGSRWLSPLVVTIALSVMVFVVGLGMRLIGPSDLDQNADQTRTLSFTADMIRNGRWLVPVDLAGSKSKKPPLVNWLDVPVVKVAGWHEWSLKFPSILASVITFGATAWIARRQLARIADTDAAALGFAAAGAWMASPTGIKHAYFMRPDMTMIACLTVGWAAGITALEAIASGKRSGVARLVFWLCVGLAALTKGPVALLLPLMLPLSSWFAFGRASPAWKMGWAWGLPLALGIFGVWFLPAAMTDPDFVFGTLAGDEMVGRLESGSPTFYDRVRIAGQTIGFFFERFIPFAVPAVIALVVWRPREIRRLGLAHAWVWVLLIVGVVALLGLRGGSYTAPAFPAAAILAVALLYDFLRTRTSINIHRWAAPLIAGGALVSAGAVGAREVWFSRGAVSGRGDAIRAFAVEAGARVGGDSVAFLDIGKSAVIVLMGRHQAGELPRESLRTFEYLVTPLQPVLGQPLIAAKAITDPKWQGPALYRVKDVIDRLPEPPTAPSKTPAEAPPPFSG